jgi:hypothetical protein
VEGNVTNGASWLNLPPIPTILNFLRNWMDVLQAIVLIITLFVLIKYTYETARLRRETQKQTELGMRPFVIISYREAEDTFKLVNLGFGLALKTRIQDLSLIDTDGLSFEYVFPEMAIIPPNTECEIKNIKKRINGDVSGADNFDLAALFPRSAQRTFEVFIKYSNLVGDEYVTKGTLGQETFDYEDIEKVGEGTRNFWRFFERREKWIKKRRPRV